MVPGVVYGTIAKTFRSHRDIVTGMTRAMAGMGYYPVLAFCAAQFLAAFARSNLGVLVALGGADGLKQLELPGPVTIFGVIPLTVLFIRRWSPSAGLWKLLAQMIPYWAGFTLIWIPLLLAWWALGLPLGLNAPYVYPAP